MKKYRDFAFPFAAIGLFIGLILFGFTVIVFQFRYEAALMSGNSNMLDKYERMLDKYDEGEISMDFIGMMNKYYQFDYMRISQVDEDGNITPLFETDYDIGAIYYGTVNEWVYVTKDDSLAGNVINYKQPEEDGFELTIRYLKCDEFWEPAETLDTYMSNSYNLMVLSDGWYHTGPDPFFFVSETYGGTFFPFLNIRSCYTDDEYLHLGVVKAGYEYLPFVKTWDFTDGSAKDKYEQDTTSDFVGSYNAYSLPVRPDKFLDEQGDIFMQDSVASMVASGKIDYGDHGYSSVREYDGRMTLGNITFYEAGGHKYLIESVITAKSFTEFYMPFLIIYAFILALICIGIPMLAALRPYRQYKKAYENNLFKNNLIDSLAHNIKTPLQILSGYAENLKDVSGSAAKDHYADCILEKTAEMNKDIEAILKTAEKTTPVLKTCSVKEIYDEAAGKIGGEFNITGDAQMAVDKEYYAQAAYALLDNASRYKTSGAVQVKIDKTAVVITNKTDRDNFTPGTGIVIAGRILEQNKLSLTTAIKGGVFEARISRK